MIFGFGSGLGKNRNRHGGSTLSEEFLSRTSTRVAAGAAFAILLLLVSITPARADHLDEDELPSRGSSVQQSQVPGKFDYYLFALTWSPAFCAGPGGQRPQSREQCRSDLGFVIHGLWPQFSDGDYPKNCGSAQALNSSHAAVAMAGALALPPGDSRFVEYEWSKHGTCSGLSQQDYFKMMAAAAERISIPIELLRLNRDMRRSVGEVKQSFVNSNPGMPIDGIEPKIDRSGRFSEVRICLTKNLAFTSCSGLRRTENSAAGVFLRSN